MAIPNSGRSCAAAGARPRRQAAQRCLAFAPGLVLLLILGFAWMASPTQLCAQAEPSESAIAYYRRLYQEARKTWRSETNRAETALRFAAACFDWADFVSDQSQRADIAQEGIQAARRAVALEPKDAAGYYYLALDLGRLAQTKFLGALKLVNEMEVNFKRSTELDPKLDFSGAHRSLGLLYRDAPGWPTSLGDRGKARNHLKKAVELSPDYPDNQLTYLESLLNWGEKKAVAEQIATVETILKNARERLTNDASRFNWPDWDKRWEKIKSRADVVAARPPKGGNTPRD